MSRTETGATLRASGGLARITRVSEAAAGALLVWTTAATWWPALSGGALHRHTLVHVELGWVELLSGLVLVAHAAAPAATERRLLRRVRGRRDAFAHQPGAIACGLAGLYLLWKALGTTMIAVGHGSALPALLALALSFGAVQCLRLCGRSFRFAVPHPATGGPGGPRVPRVPRRRVG